MWECECECGDKRGSEPAACFATSVQRCCAGAVNHDSKSARAVDGSAGNSRLSAADTVDAELAVDSDAVGDARDGGR